jgi:hypothetical protein
VYRWQNVQRKTYSVIVLEYGGRNGKASYVSKSSKTKMFQEPENYNNLPAIWRNNKKAWMTAAMMEELVNMFNAKNEEGK